MSIFDIDKPRNCVFAASIKVLSPESCLRNASNCTPCLFILFLLHRCSLHPYFLYPLVKYSALDNYSLFTAHVSSASFNDFNIFRCKVRLVCPSWQIIITNSIRIQKTLNIIRGTFVLNTFKPCYTIDKK